MRTRIVRIGFLVLFGSLVGVGQTTVLLEDNFESGVRDPSVWCFTDVFNNTQNLWKLPRVEWDSPEHGYVMRFISTGTRWRQNIRAIEVIPALGSDDVLFYELQLRLNSNSPLSYFYMSLAKEPRTGGTEGCYGCIPTPPTTQWLLGGISWRNNADAWPCEPVPPFFRLGLSTSGSWPLNEVTSDVPGSMEVGPWYTLRLVFTPSSLLFYLNGSLIVAVNKVYYDFNTAEDWHVGFGDGNSNPNAALDGVVDNVRLVVTKQVLLAIADTFGVPFDVIDPLYTQFDPETLQAALDASGGSYDQFLAYLEALLNPPQPEPEHPAPEPYLKVISVDKIEGTAIVTLQNVGDAPAEGELLIRQGLSYTAGGFIAWVPESLCQYARQTLADYVVLMPGETMAVSVELAPVPQAAVDMFRFMIERIWTGYVDPEPETDYIGLGVTIGGSTAWGYLSVPAFFPPVR